MVHSGLQLKAVAAAGSSGQPGAESAEQREVTVSLGLSLLSKEKSQSVWG